MPAASVPAHRESRGGDHGSREGKRHAHTVLGKGLSTACPSSSIARTTASRHGRSPRPAYACLSPAALGGGCHSHGAHPALCWNSPRWRVRFVTQILAIASDQKRDALKVIHTASCSPFTNWPTERTPTRYPYALDFSPGGGFLAVGNDRGCVLLYRLRHYPQA